MGQFSKDRRISVARLMPNSIIYLTTNSVVPTSVHVVRSGSLFIDRTSLANRSSPMRGFPRVGNEERDRKDIVRLSGVYCVNSAIVDKSTGKVIFKANGSACLKAVTQDLINRHTAATFSGKVDGIDFLLVHFVLIVIPFIFFIGNFAGNS